MSTARFWSNRKIHGNIFSNNFCILKQIGNLKIYHDSKYFEI